MLDARARETYDALFWFYSVRPIRSLLEKLELLLEAFRRVESPLSGFKISLAENIPLGDGFLFVIALQNKIPVVVSNDRHVLGCGEVWAYWGEPYNRGGQGLCFDPFILYLCVSICVVGNLPVSRIQGSNKAAEGCEIWVNEEECSII